MRLHELHGLTPLPWDTAYGTMVYSLWYTAYGTQLPWAHTHGY